MKNINIKQALIILLFGGIWLVVAFSPGKVADPYEFITIGEPIAMSEVDIVPPVAFTCSTTKQTAFRVGMWYHRSTIVVIDWGDGSVEPFKGTIGWWRYYYHDYASAGAYKVTVMVCDDDVDKLHLGSQEITYLDVETMDQLSYLTCNYNLISNSQDLRGLTNLEQLIAFSGTIPELFIEDLDKLYYLDVGSNDITNDQYLDGCTDLITAKINGNEIDSIYVGALTDLDIFNASYNQIDSYIDFSNCTYVRDINLQVNKVESLNVEDLQYLELLILLNNNLSANLDLRGCDSLNKLVIHDGTTTYAGNAHTLDTVRLDGLTKMEYIDGWGCSDLDCHIDLYSAPAMYNIALNNTSISSISTYPFNDSISVLVKVQLVNSNVSNTSPTFYLDNIIRNLDPGVVGTSPNIDLSGITATSTLSLHSIDLLDNYLPPNWTVTY